VPERADASTHRTLLDEVDIISSVSGGSFTSAYYSLRKDRFFDEYENRFLYRNNNLKLFLHLLSPVNWVRLASAYYGTGDLAEQYYDRLLFGGATFGDIQAQNAPLLFIQATDIVEGYPFGFTSHQFGLICSDWAGFPIARAVAASSAFPGPFEGIVLRNYAGTCEQPDVSRLTRILKKSDKGSRTYRAAFHMCSYLDSQRKPFIHLLDGGLSDNLGLRGPLEFIDLQGGLQEFLRSMGLQNTRRIAFIVVNAIGSVPEKWNSIGKIPGLGTMLEATEYVTLKLYAYDTMELLRSYIRKWSAQIENSDPGSPIDFYVIEVGFNALADDERRVLSTVPTTLSLPKATVDRLSEAGRRILYKSEDFRRLVRDLGGEILASDP
jgi:NTE family protein